MDNGRDGIRGPDALPRRRDAPETAPGIVRPQGVVAPALSVTGNETFSMDKVKRFFDGNVAPQGNALAGEMIDENGPLAGRESARGKRRSSALPMQFSDADRSVLFAPNHAPDELPQRQSDLDKLLGQQEFRERRRFTA